MTYRRIIVSIASAGLLLGLLSSCATGAAAARVLEGDGSPTAVALPLRYLEPEDGGIEPFRVSLVLEDAEGRRGDFVVALEEPYLLVEGLPAGRYRLVGHRIAFRTAKPVKVVEFEIREGEVTALDSLVRILASREGPWATTVTTRPLGEEAREELLTLLAADARLAALAPAR